MIHRKRKLLITLAAATGMAVVWLVILGSRTSVVQSSSPDGRLVARAEYPSFFVQLFGPKDLYEWKKTMWVHVEVVDRQTGERIRAHNGALSQFFGDDERPLAIRWSADGKHFAYLYQGELSSSGKVYYVSRQPLRARRSTARQDMVWARQLVENSGQSWPRFSS